MRLGVIDLVSLVASLVFAIPVANFGVIRLLAGDTVTGGALVVVAIAMVLIPQFFLDPRRIAKRLLVGLLPKRLRGLGRSEETPPEPTVEGRSLPRERPSPEEHLTPEERPPPEDGSAADERSSDCPDRVDRPTGDPID